MYCVDIPYFAKNGVAYMVNGDSEYGPEGYSYSRLWSVDESGDFRVLQTVMRDGSGESATYEVDEKSASAAEYDETIANWPTRHVMYPTALGGSGVDVATGKPRDVGATIDTVAKTLSVLSGEA